MALRQGRLRPLRDAVQRIPSPQLEPGVRTHLLQADEFLYLQRNDEAIQHLQTGLLGCSRLPELQGVVWMLLGSAHMATGNFHEASACYLRQLAICRELGDFAGITKTECNLGITYTKLGLFNMAERCLLQYLENSHRLQDQGNISKALNNLAVLSKLQGCHVFYETTKSSPGPTNKTQARQRLNSHLSRAVHYLEQHLVIEEDLSDLAKQALAYGNLGWCYQAMKQYPQALFCYRKSLEISRMRGDRTTEMCTLCHLGNCLRATGNLHEAIDCHTLNLELSRASGYKQGETISLLNLGITCEQLEQLDRAIEWYTLYLSAVLEMECLPGQAKALRTLAGIYERTQQMTKAEDHYRKLAVVLGQLGEKEEQRKTHLLVRQMKHGVKQERILSAKQSRKTLKRYKSSPRRTKTRTVSCSTIYRLPEPKRPQGNHSKRKSWRTSACFPWPAAPTVASEREGGVLVHPGPDMAQFLPMHEQLVAPNTAPQPLQCIPFKEWETPSFQHMITTDHRVLPQPSLICSDTESVTSYESIREAGRFPSSDTIGSSVNQLESVGATQPQPLSQLGSQSMDRDWEQWLCIHETTDSDLHSQVLSSLNIDTNMFYSSRPRTLSADTSWFSHHASAPHVLDH